MPTVLIIEDNDVALNLIRAGLRNDPAWEILFATDGQRGLNLALQHLANLDAVILDIYLPRLDGRTVFERIHAAAPDLPIIVVSGDPEALREMQGRGAITLSKPISSERYAEVLQMLVPPIPPTTSQPSPRAGHRSFDRQPVPRMHLLDLNIDRVQHHIRTAMELRRYEGPSDWQEFLVVNDAAVEDGSTLRPTVAGALMFAQHPERWIIASGIDIAQFSGLQPNSTKIRLQQPLRGSIPSVIERTVDLLWALIDHTSPLDSDHGITRLQLNAYPRIVLRELTVNALCHRDWSREGSIIRIQVFPNRIEWISPGGLPPGVTVEKLRDAQVAPNPALAQLLYQAGAVERFGLGIDTVLDALETAGHRPPVMEDQGISFLVRVFGIPVGDASQPAPPIANLSDRQHQILSILASGPEYRGADIARTLGYSLSSVQRDINALIQAGLVVGYGEARARRYRRRREGEP